MSEPMKFPLPFANEGDRADIPDTASGHRASIGGGFPQVTELAKNLGGMCPERSDFNGALNALSAFDFYHQSGGRFVWSRTANYAPPAVVYHNGDMWWCVKVNGADSEIIEPSTNESYWTPFIQFLKSNASQFGTNMEAPDYPIGTILPAAQIKTQPDEGQWALCDGSSASKYTEYIADTGLTTLPNFMGMFLRGAGSQTQNGTTYSATLGNFQGDAIRNLTGKFAQDDISYYPSGAFYRGDKVSYDAESSQTSKYDARYAVFDASNVVPTASENRPANKTVYWIIKVSNERTGDIKLPLFTVTVTPSANQTISYTANGKTYTETASFEQGTQIANVKATGASGYRAGTVVSSPASGTSFTLTQNVALTATKAVRACATGGTGNFGLCVRKRGAKNTYTFTVPANAQNVKMTCVDTPNKHWQGFAVLSQQDKDPWMGYSKTNTQCLEGESYIIKITGGKSYTLRPYNVNGLYSKHDKTCYFKVEWSTDINAATPTRFDE